MKKNSLYIIKVLFLNEGDIHNRMVKIHFSDSSRVFIRPNGKAAYNADYTSEAQALVAHKVAVKCLDWLNGGKKPNLKRHIKPILKSDWSDPRMPEVWALRGEIIENMKRLLLHTNDEMVVFREEDESDNDLNVYQDVNVGNKDETGCYPTVVNVHIGWDTTGAVPIVTVDDRFEHIDMLATDGEFSVDDLAAIYDAMIWIVKHPGEVFE